MGEIHRQLHNEKILRDLENSKTKFEDSMRDSTAELKNTASEIKDKLDSSTVDKS